MGTPPATENTTTESRASSGTNSHPQLHPSNTASPIKSHLSEAETHVDIVTYPSSSLLRLLSALLSEIAKSNDDHEFPPPVTPPSYCATSPTGQPFDVAPLNSPTVFGRFGSFNISSPPGGFSTICSAPISRTGSFAVSLSAAALEAQTDNPPKVDSQKDLKIDTKNTLSPGSQSHSREHSETTKKQRKTTWDPVLPFQARHIPSITIEAYLKRIMKYCPCGNEVWLGLLVWFERLSRESEEVSPDVPNDAQTTSQSKSEKEETLKNGFIIDSHNIHRLIIAGITVASKFFSDIFYTNSRYAKVGGLPLAELNQLELQFLLLLDFNLMIQKEELQMYMDHLITVWGKRLDPTDISQPLTCIQKKPEAPSSYPQSESNLSGYCGSRTKNSSTTSSTPTSSSSTTSSDASSPITSSDTHKTSEIAESISPVYPASKASASIEEVVAVAYKTSSQQNPFPVEESIERPRSITTLTSPMSTDLPLSGTSPISYKSVKKRRGSCTTGLGLSINSAPTTEGSTVIGLNHIPSRDATKKSHLERQRQKGDKNEVVRMWERDCRSASPDFKADNRPRVSHQSSPQYSPMETNLPFNPNYSMKDYSKASTSTPIVQPTQPDNYAVPPGSTTPSIQQAFHTLRSHPSVSSRFSTSSASTSGTSTITPGTPSTERGGGWSDAPSTGPDAEDSESENDDNASDETGVRRRRSRQSTASELIADFGRGKMDLNMGNSGRDERGLEVNV